MKRSPDDDAVEAGHAFYTRQSLAVYDPLILGYFSRLAWRCPAPRLLRHYDAHISANHLDVGVGTGWFLDHATFPSPTPRLALMDLNRDCLAAGLVGVAIGAGLLVPVGLLTPANRDFTIVAPVSLAVALCLTTLVLSGTTFGVLVDHVAPRWPTPRWSRRGAASLLPSAALLPAPPLLAAAVIDVLTGAVAPQLRSRAPTFTPSRPSPDVPVPEPGRSSS